MGELPVWAQRIRALRQARGWTQAEAAERMRRHTDENLPDHEHLVRRWKAWELAENKPGKHYATLIAATLETVTASLFPPDAHARRDVDVLSATGMDTLEIVSRLNASDLNDATLHGLRITVETLCAEYSHGEPVELITEGRRWLRRIVEMQEQRLTFAQRRQSLEQAGWLALLIGCLEYDVGDRRGAEATRKAALSLGAEIGHRGILGWAHEMRAWFSLMAGDYRGVVDAAHIGEAAAGSEGVSVQLLAQEAKAWARMGHVENMRRALDRGREVLEALPYPDNIASHFVVDPGKYDFYAMDCHCYVGEDRLAEALARDVIRAGAHGRSPMRVSWAQGTLGIVAARAGELDQAIEHGRSALGTGRTSLPSFAVLYQDLAEAIAARYPKEVAARDFLAELRAAP
ncbi:helix-turn-helix domain-containing protein [Actinokineospora sp. NPDC004072]